MTFGFIGEIKETDSVVWKTEGLTDALAILSLSPPEGHVATCNACGAEETPTAEANLYLRRFTDKEVFVVHDCDQSGQRGSLGFEKRIGWAQAIAKYAKIVHNVELPYPIVASHGKDVRDWIEEQKSAGKSDEAIYLELIALGRSGPVIHSTDAVDRALEQMAASGEEFATPDEFPDDPHRLARINIENYRNEHGGELRYHRDQWWKYRNGVYRMITDKELESKVMQSIKREFDSLWREETERYEAWRISDAYDEAKDKGPPKVRPVRGRTVKDTVAALKSLCLLSSNVPMPSWLPDRTQPHILSLKNGLLHLDAVFRNAPESECLTEHSSDWFCAVKLDYPFDPTAECPLWLQYLEYSLEGDVQRINLLQEWAGYLLTASNEYQKFLVLEGDGGNGKTVFFAAMTAMLGKENVSQVSLENFAGRFDLGTTIGKAANISGDVGEVDHLAEGILKQYTGGEIMQFDRKNKDPISARPTAKLMCAWNERPRIRDKSQGLWRRMLLVPFQRTIEEHMKVRGMDEADWWIRQNEVSGILGWAIVGLHRLREQQGFTEPDVSYNAIRDYREEANPFLRFATEVIRILPEPMLTEERDRPLSDQFAIKCDDVYDRYREWSDREGVRQMTRSSFGKQMKRFFGDIRHQRRDGSDRVYVYRLICFQTDIDESGESTF